MQASRFSRVAVIGFGARTRAAARMLIRQPATLTCLDDASISVENIPRSPLMQMRARAHLRYGRHATIEDEPCINRRPRPAEMRHLPHFSPHRHFDEDIISALILITPLADRWTRRATNASPPYDKKIDADDDGYNVRSECRVSPEGLGLFRPQRLHPSKARISHHYSPPPKYQCTPRVMSRKKCARSKAAPSSNTSLHVPPQMRQYYIIRIISRLSAGAISPRRFQHHYYAIPSPSSPPPQRRHLRLHDGSLTSPMSIS